MLPRQQRLRSPRDFLAIRQRGHRWRGDLLVLNALQSDFPYARFGVVVSKQIGKAVHRNRVKRRLRVAIRRWLPGVKIGYDVVVVALPAAAGVTFQEIEAQLGDLLGQARLLPNNE